MHTHICRYIYSYVLNHKYESVHEKLNTWCITQRGFESSMCSHASVLEPPLEDNAQQDFHSKRALSTPITSSSRLQAPLTVQNLKLLLLNSAPPTPQKGLAPVTGGGEWPGSTVPRGLAQSSTVKLPGRSILKQHQRGCSTVLEAGVQTGSAQLCTNTPRAIMCNVSAYNLYNNSNTQNEIARACS
jgi:hypothetical protein